MNATSISSEPSNVYRKNLTAAYTRFGPPQTPMIRNIGISIASKNTIEQDRIERGEHAVDEAGHDQERGHVLRDAFLDHFPAGDDDQHRGEAVQQDEQHRDAVHAERVIDVEARYPRRAFDELHAGGAVVETGPQRNGYGEPDQRTHQRDPARGIFLLFAIEEQREYACQNRHPDGQANSEAALHFCFFRLF